MSNLFNDFFNNVKKDLEAPKVESKLQAEASLLLKESYSSKR